jgi:leader peptidase (prepilin peptidase) / N-methyltransferase
VVSALFFVFGLVVGSFLNVCITRIPENESIVAPGSHCPRCGTPIRPYDNIPILSWFLLRGKCRDCGQPISILYPTIELLTGVLFVACYWNFGLSLVALKWVVFTSLIIVLTVTDFRVRLLPDAVNWYGACIGVAFAVRAYPGDEFVRELAMRYVPISPASPWMAPIAGVLDALCGAAFGGLLLWGSAAIYRLARKREGMGLGDMKMMVMVGTFLGVRGTFLTILIGTLLGSIIGLAVVLSLYFGGWKKAIAARASRMGKGKESGIRWTIASRYQLPLGTFLGAGALLFVHFDSWIGSELLKILR